MGMKSLRDKVFTEERDIGEYVGEFEPLPSNPEYLLNLWAGIVKGGAGRILLALGESYPEKLTREEIGERVGLVPTSGTFNTYLSTLRRNDLIVADSGGISVSKEIMETE
jgi:hypothetical protein